MEWRGINELTMANKIRNTFLRDSVVETIVGTIHLDAEGYVTDTLSKEVYKTVSRLPTFFEEIDTTVELEEELPIQAEQSLSEEDQERFLCLLIVDLKKDPKNVNSVGSLDLNVLNKALREKKMSPITGGRRKELELKIEQEGYL